MKSRYWRCQRARSRRSKRLIAMPYATGSGVRFPQELSEPLQVVVLLRYFSDVSTYSQIAALLGVPVGTVRSRLNEAKRRLGAALLATARASHDDVALLTSHHRRREIADLFAAAEQGQVSRALADSWASDLELIGPQGQTSRSREVLRIMESDLEAGVHQRVVEVTASQRFTIIESDLLSPPWDPDHCPTGVVWLLTLHDHRVERVRLFHP